MTDLDLTKAIQAAQEAASCELTTERYCEAHDIPVINGECHGVLAREIITAALPHVREQLAQEILRAIVPIQPVGTMHEGENRGLRLAARIAKGPQQ